MNKDIDRKAVYLNTTYYPIDVDTEVKGIIDFCSNEIFPKVHVETALPSDLERSQTVSEPLAYLLQ